VNAIASQQAPADAQGELQGAIACLYSLSAIVGPPFMTQIFGYFSAPQAAVRFPGAPFVAAALLTLGSAAFLVRALRLAPPAALSMAPGEG
jgi:DHA1 family tetracycline resistance protein-like MFS transporter